MMRPLEHRSLTRVERLSCLYLLLFSLLLASLSFYETKASDPDIAVEVGSFGLAWSQLIIGESRLSGRNRRENTCRLLSHFENRCVIAKACCCRNSCGLNAKTTL